MPLTNLDILDICDSHPSPLRDPEGYLEALSNYTLFKCNGVTLGYVLPSVNAALRSSKAGDWIVNEKVIEFNPTYDTFEKRTAAMKKTLDLWRQEKRFKVLKGWRNELYSVYGLNGEILFAMERCATPLFGVVTYGAHMTVYVPATESQPMRIWTPRRSAHKPTYPSMLDNSVGGGIEHGVSVLNTIIRESGEEASLPPDLVRSQAVLAGAVTYFHIRDASAGDEVGFLQPEVQYAYDLAVPEDAVLAPNDGEVESFSLMSIPEVQRCLAAGEFKPNCAIVILDFFVRHGILTPENERDYLQIVGRLRRGLPFPLPS